MSELIIKEVIQSEIDEIFSDIQDEIRQITEAYEDLKIRVFEHRGDLHYREIWSGYKTHKKDTTCLFLTPNYHTIQNRRGERFGAGSVVFIPGTAEITFLGLSSREDLGVREKYWVTLDKNNEIEFYLKSDCDYSDNMIIYFTKEELKEAIIRAILLEKAREINQYDKSHR